MPSPSARDEAQGAIQDALQALRTRQPTLDAGSGRRADTHITPCGETQPDAKRLRSGRAAILVGDQVPIAVAAHNGLIGHHHVTDEGRGPRPLASMARVPQAEVAVDRRAGLAEAGDAQGEPRGNGDDQGSTATVPTNRAVNHLGEHDPTRDVHDAAEPDQWIGPAGPGSE